MTVSLAEERAKYVTALEQALAGIVRILSEQENVQRIILFGSYATGRRDLFTDLDIIVVMNSDQDFITRTASLRQQLLFPVDMDLLVYTPEEFEAMKDGRFLRHALASGKVLYER